LIKLAHFNHPNNTVAIKSLADIDEFTINFDGLNMIEACTAIAAAIWLIRNALIKIFFTEAGVESAGLVAAPRHDVAGNQQAAVGKPRHAASATVAAEYRAAKKNAV
jgi:hypothetical protein